MNRPTTARRLPLLAVLLSACSRPAAPPLTNTSDAEPPKTEAIRPPDPEPPPPPLEPAIAWPAPTYRFPADVAFIRENCVVTVDGEAFCRQDTVDFARVTEPEVELMHAAAFSPGCRAAVDGGAACLQAYREAQRRTKKELHGAAMVDGIDNVRWNRTKAYGGSSAEPYPRKFGGRPPRSPEGVVSVACAEDEDYGDGLIWLSAGKVDARCGYDTKAWRDIIQISGHSGTLCGVSSHGELRCASESDRSVPGPMSEVAEVSVGQYATCIRKRDGRVTCFGQARDYPPTKLLLESGPIGRQRIELDIEGATAVHVNYGGTCVATGDTLHCTGSRAGEFGAAVPVRGLPPVVAATRMNEGGVAIDSLGATIVWGPATGFVPTRAPIQLAALGGGVALTTRGDLVEYDPLSGHWLTRMVDFWPTPPGQVRLAATRSTIVGNQTVDGCAESGEQSRCWTRRERQIDGPFFADTSDASRDLARAAFSSTAEALRPLENIVYSDADVAIDLDGRLWFDGPEGTPALSSEPRRWTAQTVRDGLEGPSPQLSLPQPPPAERPEAVVTVESDERFDALQGFCASAGGRAWCFGKDPDTRSVTVYRVPRYDGLTSTTDDGGCALVGKEILCGCTSEPETNRAAVMLDEHWLDPRGRIRPIRWQREVKGRVPSDTVGLAQVNGHWASLSSDGTVSLHPSKVGFGGTSEFPELDALFGSEQIAGAKDRLCGLRKGEVICADAKEAATRMAGKTWRVPRLQDAKALVMGGDKGVGRTCVLRQDGTVTCFGRLFANRFLDPDFTRPIVPGLQPTVTHLDEPPTDVGLEGVSDIWLGERGGLVVIRDGHVTGFEMEWAQRAPPRQCPLRR